MWEAPHLGALVWHKSRRKGPPPTGWEIQTLMLNHWELGGVTDGTFHVQVAL